MSTPKCTGRLFVVSGPSGSGKSTVLSKVLSRNALLFFSISATTRTPRPGEQQGVNYFFISRDEFNNKIKEDEFFEYAEYSGNLYGTPRDSIEEKMRDGIDVILDIEVKGAAQIKAKMPDCISVFIIPPKFSDLKGRLINRSTDNSATIENRLKIATEEYKQASTYDYIVVNDDIETAANEIMSIITAEKCRTELRISHTDTSI